MKIKISRAFALLFLVLFSCTSPTDNQGTYVPPELDRRDEIRYKQYLVNGQRSYLTYCSNCHGKQGQGIAKLYPPLANADFVQNNNQKLACIIKYGQKGKIMVNGVEYNMPMPGQQELSNIEIAEIVNFIANSWGNKAGFQPVNEIEQHLKSCNPTD